MSYNNVPYFDDDKKVTRLRCPIPHNKDELRVQAALGTYKYSTYIMALWHRLPNSEVMKGTYYQVDVFAPANSLLYDVAQKFASQYDAAVRFKVYFLSEFNKIPIPPIEKRFTIGHNPYTRDGFAIYL